MTSDDLTHERLQKLNETLGPMLGSLSELSDRMCRAGFPTNDPLLGKVYAAKDDMMRLTVDLRYKNSSGCPGAQASSETTVTIINPR